MHDIAEGIVGDFTPYDKITYFIHNSANRKSTRNNYKLSRRSLSLWVKTDSTLLKDGLNLKKKSV